MTELAQPYPGSMGRPKTESPVRSIQMPDIHRISRFAATCFTGRANEGVAGGLLVGVLAGILILEVVTEIGWVSNPNSMPTPPVYSPKAVVVASIK